MSIQYSHMYSRESTYFQHELESNIEQNQRDRRPRNLGRSAAAPVKLPRLEYPPGRTNKRHVENEFNQITPFFRGKMTSCAIVILGDPVVFRQFNHHPSRWSWYCPGPWGAPKQLHAFFLRTGRQALETAVVPRRSSFSVPCRFRLSNKRPIRTRSSRLNQFIPPE